MTQASNADPFAAAASNASTTPADPNADPFSQPSEVKGGGGPRRPSPEDLYGQLVVMRPVKLEIVPVNPKFAKTPGETGERYTVTLTVLSTPQNAGKLNVWDPNLNGPDAGGNIEYDLPFTWEGVYFSQGSIIGKLKGVEKLATPILLGVMRRCPLAAGYKVGETPDAIDAKFNGWVNGGKRGPAPSFSWGLTDFTDEQRAIALAWYRGQ